MSNYKIYKKKNKWIIEHIYFAAVYKKSFRFKFMAEIKKFLLDLRGV